MSEPGAADAVALLEEIKRLMDLKGENPFKARAFEKAAASVAGHGDLAERARKGTLTELAGIGKSIAEVLTEFLTTGKSTVRDELMASLPAGLSELTEIPGLGPKKALLLIEELGISSVAELEYACKENRLLKLAGFGAKLQAKILEGVQFRKSTQNQQRLSDAFGAAERVFRVLTQTAGGLRVSETGALRRRMETLSALEYLVELPAEESKAAKLRQSLENAVAALPSGPGSLPARVHFADPGSFGSELARTTATEAHWKAVGSPAALRAASEEEFYAAIGTPWIPPEARETGEEVSLARAGKLERLLPWDGIRGVFHNHTTRSDGTASLEEMVAAARERGYEYIGISDHSQSAFYAQGLKTDALADQEREVRKVQEKFPDIRVFWGIESDILADGSLDYDRSVLERFDFVIASVHSRFGMDRDTMTGRILEAVRNPCTRFLGHVTGRLLLGRKGYEVDLERVIAEAASHDVAIEINANPARLDIDWRWGPELRRRGTKVSVNPDAHETAGLDDVKFGVAMARKALLPGELVVNARSVDEVAKWLKRG
ncbi:MAG TPA: helix-hairpin-helix domain-containing protein [Bdellovibrionota bacterium]|nr:helix-hairpin-helix domain-containing protein [Bdellovibrionota bacterium]